MTGASTPPGQAPADRRLVGGGLRPGQGLVIAGCSRRKADTTVPVPALDLYEGGCIPQLRSRFAHRSALRRRVRIISAAYGLIGPDHPVTPYDQRLESVEDAERLAARVADAVDAELAASPGLAEALVVAEPLYALALGALFDHAARLRITQVTDPHGWADASAVLDRWGW